MWNPESWALESGVQLKESRMPLTIRTENRQRLKWSTCNPESMTWNPESQTIVDSLTWGDL